MSVWWWTVSGVLALLALHVVLMAAAAFVADTRPEARWVLLAGACTSLAGIPMVMVGAVLLSAGPR